ncbi:MAG: tol-pal system protein YbgF [Desulfobacterales bacterium]|nr:MAG: tol-pal system protein YbgF [Desulfobacterales bacterium]
MHNYILKSTVLLIPACLLILSGCVGQNEITSLDTRLSELELRNAETRKKSEALKSDLNSRQEDEQALRLQIASLRQQLAGVNEEVRTLTGRIEELEHLINRQTQQDKNLISSEEDRVDQLAKAARSNDERILRIEQYLNFETAAPATAPEGPSTRIVPAETIKKESSEEEIYRQAKQAFDQGDSDTARNQFRELIERYPKSERADNAQFWIGEIYYREKWYEKAILEYQKVIENYPKGNKVPASLLKQGFAFLNLGDKANSRIILQELIKKYPQTNEAKIAADKLKDLN